MKKNFIVTLIILSLLFVTVPVLASDDCDGGGGGNAKGSIKEMVDKADNLGLVDSHAFHTVRGITVLNMVDGAGNQVLAKTNVFFVDNITDEFFNNDLNNDINQTSESAETEELEDQVSYNRIATHAFHDVKGVTMVQMVSGNNNSVNTNFNVVMTAGFMANAHEMFHTEEHDHQ
mgnify:CR=1 FL=1